MFLIHEARALYKATVLLSNRLWKFPYIMCSLCSVLSFAQGVRKLSGSVVPVLQAGSERVSQDIDDGNDRTRRGEGRMITGCVKVVMDPVCALR